MVTHLEHDWRTSAWEKRVDPEISEKRPLEEQLTATAKTLIYLRGWVIFTTGNTCDPKVFPHGVSRTGSLLSTLTFIGSLA